MFGQLNSEIFQWIVEPYLERYTSKVNPMFSISLNCILVETAVLSTYFILPISRAQHNLFELNVQIAQFTNGESQCNKLNLVCCRVGALVMGVDKY